MLGSHRLVYLHTSVKLRLFVFVCTTVMHLCSLCDGRKHTRNDDDDDVMLLMC